MFRLADQEREERRVMSFDDVIRLSFLFGTATLLFFCGFVCQEKTESLSLCAQLSLLPHSFPTSNLSPYIFVKRHLSVEGIRADEGGKGHRSVSGRILNKDTPRYFRQDTIQHLLGQRL